MKQLLFLILILNLFQSLCKAQTNVYHPFSDSAYWRVDAWATAIHGNCQQLNYYHYNFGGDTLINDVTYKKIIRQYSQMILHGVDTPCLIWSFPIDTGYMGALREDSLVNKVFYIFPLDTIQTTLFDYNVIAGDTILGDRIITSVDSVLIGTGYRKRWNYLGNNQAPQYFIQGIGSKRGLYEGLMSEGDLWGTNLICVFQNANILFSTGYESKIGCQIVTSIHPVSPSSSSITVYPNPVNTHLTIQSSEKIYSLRIIDIMGREIEANTLSAAEGQTVLDVSYLEQGVYVFIINNNVMCKVVVE